MSSSCLKTESVDKPVGAVTVQCKHITLFSRVEFLPFPNSTCVVTSYTNFLRSFCILRFTFKIYLLKEKLVLHAINKNTYLVIKSVQLASVVHMPSCQRTLLGNTT